VFVKKTEGIAKDKVPAGKGAWRQVLISAEEAPHFAMRRFIVEPGGGIPGHTNTVEHEQFVLRGRARIGIGDAVHEVCANDVVYIPAGAAHWYEVIGEEPFEFLCMVPNKEDIIEFFDEKGR
jgi:quercetin dioxygenase-like cupin family protein